MTPEDLAKRIAKLFPGARAVSHEPTPEERRAMLENVTGFTARLVAENGKLVGAVCGGWPHQGVGPRVALPISIRFNQG